MSTTNGSNTPRRRGRPACRPFQFAARVLHYGSGWNEKYCRTLIDENVTELGAREWALIALAVDEGCSTMAEFEAWLDEVGFRR